MGFFLLFSAKLLFTFSRHCCMKYCLMPSIRGLVGLNPLILGNFSATIYFLVNKFCPQYAEVLISTWATRHERLISSSYGAFLQNQSNYSRLRCRYFALHQKRLSIGLSRRKNFFTISHYFWGFWKPGVREILNHIEKILRG